MTFIIYDRDFVASKRRERGYGINPWKTHTRFIISHSLLRDEAYAAPLRDWLQEFSAGSMLILDEAHNVAPASASRYAIDSQLTRTVRDLAPRFKHKLFLSATSHNGMHILPAEQSRAFFKIITLLKPGKLLAITLRQGGAEADREIYEVTWEELERLAREHGATIV